MNKIKEIIAGLAALVTIGGCANPEVVAEGKFYGSEVDVVRYSNGLGEGFFKNSHEVIIKNSDGSPRIIGIDRGEDKMFEYVWLCDHDEMLNIWYIGGYKNSSIIPFEAYDSFIGSNISRGEMRNIYFDGEGKVFSVFPRMWTEGISKKFIENAMRNISAYQDSLQQAMAATTYRY
jgi:hypothetical protein